MEFGTNVFKLEQRWMLFIVCALGGVLIWGAVQLGNSASPIKQFGPGVEYIADVDEEYSLEQVVALPDLAWTTEKREQLSFGMADHPYWLRFTLPFATSDSPRLVEIDYALLDKVNIWFYDGQALISQAFLGDSLPFEQRIIKHEKFIFPVPQVAQPLTVILKVQSDGTLRLPINLWEKDTFLVFNGEHSVVMGLFFGFMAAMGLSNLFFFVTTRSLTFLSYCGYVVCLALTLATLHGLGYKYLWPENIWLQSRSVGIFGSGAIFFALIFSNQLLEVKLNSLILHRILNVATAIMACAILLSLLIPYYIYVKIYLLMVSVTVMLIYTVGILLWYKGMKLARFFTIAWTALLLSGFIASLDNWNLISLDTPSHYLLIFGATVETFLLALALALSYSLQRQQLFDTQEVALQKERMARKAQDDILKVKEESQAELEYKVEERTLELEIALRELSETNRELEQKNTMDALTGIRNRSYFDKKYLAEVRRSRREQTELSVVMLDIDHFKNINDRYGHLIGDDSIKLVAQILQGNLKRPSDDVCRYGGEEFALILPNTDLAGAKQLVENMRSEVENTPLETDSGTINMTLSAGICAATVRSMDDEKNILGQADSALYAAKQQGRNRICVSLIEPNTTLTQE